MGFLSFLGAGNEPRPRICCAATPRPLPYTHSRLKKAKYTPGSKAELGPDPEISQASRQVLRRSSFSQALLRGPWLSGLREPQARDCPVRGSCSNHICLTGASTSPSTTFEWKGGYGSRVGILLVQTTLALHSGRLSTSGVHTAKLMSRNRGTLEAPGEGKLGRSGAKSSGYVLLWLRVHLEPL